MVWKTVWTRGCTTSSHPGARGFTTSMQRCGRAQPRAAALASCRCSIVALLVLMLFRIVLRSSASVNSNRKRQQTNYLRTLIQGKMYVTDSFSKGYVY